jgi:hypothetical protein
MGIWPVIVDQWQQDCCGEPFAVGDDVEWPLMVLDHERAAVPDDLHADLRATVETVETRYGGLALRLVTPDGVSAAWSGEATDGETVQLRAVLVQERHGGVPDEIPVTHGTVRRIRVMTSVYERRGRVAWVPTGERPELHDLSEIPSDVFSPDPPGPADPVGTWRAQTGILVDLDVTPG